MYNYLAVEIAGDEAAKNAAVNADGKILIAVFGCVSATSNSASLSFSLSLSLSLTLHTDLELSAFSSMISQPHAQDPRGAHARL